jgi:hypothetical protein
MKGQPRIFQERREVLVIVFFAYTYVFQHRSQVHRGRTASAVHILLLVVLTAVFLSKTAVNRHSFPIEVNYS